jgi:hypothetical protein
MIKIWQSEKKKDRNLANLGQFFPWKILCIGRNHIFQLEIWRKKKKHCLSKCLSSAVSHLRSSPFLCSPLIFRRAHESNGGRIYALESGMYALAFASTQCPRKHSLRIIGTSANMVTSLLTPLKSKNSSTQTLKNLNLSSTKTIKAQHSTAHCTSVFFFQFWELALVAPSAHSVCGARMTSSLKLREPSLAPLLVFYSKCGY